MSTLQSFLPNIDLAQAKTKKIVQLPHLATSSLKQSRHNFPALFLKRKLQRLSAQNFHVEQTHS